MHALLAATMAAMTSVATQSALCALGRGDDQHKEHPELPLGIENVLPMTSVVAQLGTTLSGFLLRHIVVLSKPNPSGTVHFPVT